MKKALSGFRLAAASAACAPKQATFVQVDDVALGRVVIYHCTGQHAQGQRAARSGQPRRRRAHLNHRGTGLEARRPPGGARAFRPRTTDCLDVDELVAMAEHGVAAHRRDVVLAHIDRCSHCAEVVAHLGALDRQARCIGRYQIERVIGAGGMGIVYAAYDPRLERKVAIKLVRPENTGGLAQQLMIAEGRAQAQIAHPNVVAVYDTGDHEGQAYLATELVEGTTLAEWQAHPRSTAEIVGAWIQVARGLAAAHAVGVVHGDVKAKNVLVGGGGRIQIGDFGLARRDPPTTDAGPTSAIVGGTPQYMAPEHHTGHVEARSDQYSVCVAIAEALTGTRSEANHVVSVEPRALAAVLTRGVRRDPDERFASIDDLADALAAAIAP